MKEKILTIINDKKYQPLTTLEIGNVLELTSDSEIQMLQAELDNLVANDEILMNKKKTRYINLASAGLYRGIITIKNQNYGFIKTDDFAFDFYVSKYDFLKAMDKDEVLFSIIKTNDSQKNNSEARVVKILNRSLKYVVGELKLKKDKYFLELEDSTINKRINIIDIGNAKPSDIVRAIILKYELEYCEANVIDVVGNKSDIGIDITQIALQRGFNLQFPDEVLYQASHLEDDTMIETTKRRDLRDQLIVTIDGIDAKDLDDAVSIKQLKNGNYLLGVYIADVSYFVSEGSKIDKEAYNRGTSVYLVDRVIPMLPVRLSNDLCSLNPNQDKLVIGCEMEVNRDGKVLTSDIFPGVIKTTKRLNYTDCNKVLNDGIKLVPDYEIVYDSLVKMHELANILTEKRRKRGSLDFDVPEGKIIVDEKGIPIDLVVRDRGISERIIEEFMILANETVSEVINHMDLPFIYRVHDKPDILKLSDLKTTANYLGYNLRTTHVAELQKFLDNIEEKDAFLKTVVLRMMAKAVYSEENIGHFGLASECYTHFTSPIRRYPDLIVHRLLRKYIFNGDIDANEFTSLTQKIADIALQASQRERGAADCEYAVLDMKKAEYMSYFIGQTFTGTISTITGFGMFISLDNTAEGLIRLKDLSDDYYTFNQTNHVLVGERTNKKYRVGDRVQVKLINADKKTSEIDFKIVYNKDRTYQKDRSKEVSERYGRTKHRRAK
ncbi:MAG: ribonuclease R [Bacilli bacterium]|nr:ribonuclease R [Bacilli bacterium]